MIAVRVGKPPILPISNLAVSLAWFEHDLIEEDLEVQRPDAYSPSLLTFHPSREPEPPV
jgi:hypothetical protein